MNVGSAVSDLLRKFNETYDYQIRPSMRYRDSD